MRGFLSTNAARVMIEKFATVGSKAQSDFLDLNHTNTSMILVSLMIPKFAPDLAESAGELRNRGTSAAKPNGRRRLLVTTFAKGSKP